METEISQQQWKGLAPQRFSGGSRVHLRQQDQLGNNYEGLAEQTLGRKHFEPIFSQTSQYKPFIRVDQTRNVESMKSDPIPKKLVYVPQQRKSKPQQFQVQARKSERDRFSRQIGMMTFKMSSKTLNKQEEIENNQKLQSASKIQQKLTQYQRDKLEQENEDQIVVSSLEQWEDTRRNPNYKLIQQQQQYSKHKNTNK